MEAVHTVVALRHCKERLAVRAFYADNQIILAIQADRAGIQRCIDAEALHEMRICLRVHIILPEQRYHLPRHHRIDPAVQNAVVKTVINMVLSGEQIVQFCLLSAQVLLKFGHALLLRQNP